MVQNLETPGLSGRVDSPDTCMCGNHDVKCAILTYKSVSDQEFIWNYQRSWGVRSVTNFR